MHGSGFTGSGERVLESVVGLEASVHGKVRVLAASTEIGQGANTIFCQIVSDAMGISPELVEVAQPDTAEVPNSGPTVASRTTMVVGFLLEKAALVLKKNLIESGFIKEGFSEQEFKDGVRNYISTFGSLKTYSKYKQPEFIDWDDQTYKGDAYGTYAWATYLAEVSVDTTTYEVLVDNFLALQEVGKVINPIMAEGQIQGGVAQGIGYGVYENVVWQDGVMINNQMTNYIMPTSADLPNIKVVFLENGHELGPGGGAKGIGELPMDGPAPAILNAVHNATGININQIPATPEVVFEHFKKE